jgi:PAS domain S-box-containing protein
MFRIGAHGQPTMTGESLTEEILRNNEARLRLIMGQVPAVIWTTDTELRITSNSGAGLQALGYQSPDTPGKTLYDVLESTDPESQPVAAHLRCLKGESSSYEHEFGGSLFQTRVEPLRDANGQITGCIGLALDISARHHAEEALRLLVEVTAAANEGGTLDEVMARCLEKICTLKHWDFGQAWVPDSSREVMACTPSVCQLTSELSEFRQASLDTRLIRGRGLPGRVWKTGAPVWMVDVTQEAEFSREEAALGAGLRSAFAFPIKVNDEVLAVFEFFSPEIRNLDRYFMDAVQKLGSHLGIVFERKHAEMALQESERQFRAVFDNSLDAMLIADDTRRYIDANPAACRLLGLSKEQLIGRRIDDFVPEAALLKMQEIWARMVKQGEDQGEFRLQLPDGSIRDIEYSAKANFLPGLHLSSNKDITERKRAEQALRELSARLIRAQDEERRRIARDLHDSTAQTLSALAINLALLSQRAPNLEGKASEALKDSLKLVDEASREIRTLSRLLHPPQLDDVGLPAAARAYINGFGQRSGIAVSVDAPERFPERLPEDVETALFRILREALTNIHRHSGSATAHVGLAADSDRVILEIRDDGRGIPPEVMGCGPKAIPRLGVGLAGMRERVIQLGGSIDIESGPAGTRVRTSIPLST